MPEHNYMKKIDAMLEAGEIQPGEVSELYVRHDDWCLFLNAPGSPCNCNPVITRTPPERQVLAQEPDR